MNRPQRISRESKSPSPPSTGCILVDPGSTVLRLLAAEVEDAHAIILGWAEQPVPAPTTPGGSVPGLLALCQEALANAEEMARKLNVYWLPPDQMIVGLSASQLRGRAWSVTQRRSQPSRPIEERELRALLERTLRLAINRLRSEVADEAGWSLVDAVLVALSVDGHGVTDPVGFRGQEFGATVFAALARVEAIQAWGAIAQQLDFSTLTVTGTPLALAGALSASQGLLVDVGGMCTDLIWSRAGRPVALHSLPIGGATLTNSLMETWRLSPERAEQLKLAYSAGRLSEEAMVQVRAALVPALRAWRDEVEAALILFNQEEPLPSRLVLLGGGSVLPGMAESLRTLAWSERLSFARYPQINQLRPTDLGGVINRTDRGRKLGDVSALALAAWMVQQNRRSDRPFRILRELCWD
ncbi:MAG: cell division FtsA domain-containing protein [Anaerolineae bacterium]